MLSTASYCQEKIQTETSAPGIMTARILPVGTDFGFPMARLGDPVTLTFDIMDDEYSNLYYSVQHLDCDFQPDDLSFSEYADGFNDRPLQDYEQSFNTHASFSHYTITIPNRDIQPTISGNYQISVYEPDEPDNPILTKHFMLYEEDEKSRISAKVNQPFLPEYQFTHQQIDLAINDSRLKSQNPERYLKVFVQQNGDPNLRHRLEVSGYLNNDIQYRKNDGGNLFPGGNEFLFIDAKDVHFRPLGVDGILFRDGRYHYYTSPTEHYNASDTRKDLNGQYYVKNDRAYNLALESDYIDVTFRLKYDPFTNYGIYLYGALTNYRRDDSSLLRWNEESELWETTITIKQGLYNYQFIMEDADGNIMDYSHGSHFNTENEYLITVYTSYTRNRGDRLVMAKVVK